MYAIVDNTFLDHIKFADITIIVLDECRDAKLKLSDFVMHNLVLHIALMVQRIRSGYPLAFFPFQQLFANQTSIKWLYVFYIE